MMLHPAWVDRNINIAPPQKESFMLVPRQKTPSLAVETLSHGSFDLASEKSERGIATCLYRGLHCPICTNYLTEFEKQTPALSEA